MTPNAVATLILPVSERDHIQGLPTAPVTLVEYGDYECPYCSQAHVVVQALQRGLGNLLCFVFRNFPLTTVHPHAEHAAEAAEATGAQGQFWEMHHCLFTHQQALDDVHLLAYAAQLGLDVPRFGREMAHHRYAARVREDFMSGVRSGVNGTPTFFINGMCYNGSLDLDTLLAAIADAAEEHGR
jgi:protein-disulfide isomerase